MKLAEWVLGLLSSGPSGGTEPYSVLFDSEKAVGVVNRVFPGFTSSLPGKTVLDLGCGEGHQCAAFALLGARHVVGIDPTPAQNRTAAALIEKLQLTGRVTICPRLEDAPLSRFDIVFSQDSMEHFTDPGGALAQMKGALEPRGRIFLTFGPSWYSAYGAHMHFFTWL